MENQLATAIDAAMRAGEEILRIYRSDFSATVQTKEDQSPLTLADTTANEVICAILRKAFPQIPILSEESTSETVPPEASPCWVVDPLDGTKEFISKNDQFTVNIGLVQDHRVILGVVYVPVTKELFYAVKGHGAWRFTNRGEPQRIQVSDKLDALIWVGSKSHSSEKEQALIKAQGERIAGTIAVGSSLKGTMVAEARADIYYRFGYTYEWDTCAMQCVAEEAGAIFRQMDGSEMLYNRENHLNEKGFYIVNRKENIWI